MFLLIISLLFPVFASLFWAVILSGDKKNSNIPRSFLAKFMFLSFLLYTCKFCYYQHLDDIYIYFDAFYLYIGSLVYPMYHIYFRLLTVDKKFSWKAHSKYLILPIILVSIYEVGVLFTPAIEFKASLFDADAFTNSPHIRFLNIMRSLLRLYFQIQLIITVIQNYNLLRKYNVKAEQFYSDVNDWKYNNAKNLNLCMIITGVYALVTYFIMKRHPEMIYLFPPVFAIIMFIIGYMGFHQKPVNPTFDLEVETRGNTGNMEPLTYAQKQILEKLLNEFDDKKMYLNSQLNILDVAKAVGTNRSYISAIINQQYNQNFCSFVNAYRIEELHKIYAENPYSTNEMLVECCGFGSVSSLKRAVFSKTDLSFVEWKKQALLAPK